MVFECWSLLLNYVENSKRGTRAGGPTILYLGLGHMEDSEQSDIKNELFEIWDNFINASKANYRLDAELIFIPCLAGYHYFCVCINFLNKEISVIDSQSYANWESSFTYDIAMAAAGCMSDYLDTKGDVRVTEMLRYPVVNVKFKWQKRASVFEESACITMTAVSNFLGYANKSSLLNNTFYRRACASQIAACLLMADINKIRAELLDAVEIFKKSKKTIWPDIAARREAARMLKGKATEDELSDKEPPIENEPKPLNTEMPVLRFKVKIK
ncbi:uncharacterized protein LOC141603397 isoform X2 [Silene latifolia]|uniref:uncharacterized protein LOC141603397 isoform X2 n=1 Tax=Silene latifolia TaxID=37657 RepID=UPI003D76EDB3